MSASLLVLALAVQGISAEFCDFYGYYYDTSFTVSNQAEVDARFGGCTQIRGNINIATNYTGPFYLPNVTSIDGAISTKEVYDADADRDNRYTYPPTPLLTSIEFPDLNETSILEIHAVPGLKTISFPSLTVINSSYFIVDGIQDCYLDFPSLKSTKSMMISGNMTKMNFPALVNTDELRVTRKPGGELGNSFYLAEDYMLVDRVDKIPMDISFPALQKARSIYFEGNISSLSLPRLSAIGTAEEYYNRFLRISTYGNPLNISLPSLSDVEELIFAGTIGNLSYPLVHSLERFELNTSTPLNVTLEPINVIFGSTYGYLRLEGNFTAVSMTSIQKLGTVVIASSSSEFYCSSIAADIERVTDEHNTYECEGHPPKSKLPLILGLSIGLGIPVALALTYGVHRWCAMLSRSDRFAVKPVERLPEYELGVPPTYTTDGPPTYDASEEGRTSDRGAGGVAGSDTEGARNVNADGVSERSVDDATSARLGDGSSALQEGASGRRVV
ncbi:hypothetical protein V492_01491 [Pseudogymnoascus sp. VKM F-4246]|nr:hypothetical protein V492_01491 [Pseudogymnoascus sp. VKM F-4246]